MTFIRLFCLLPASAFLISCTSSESSSEISPQSPNGNKVTENTDDNSTLPKLDDFQADANLCDDFTIQNPVFRRNKKWTEIIKEQIRENEPHCLAWALQNGGDPNEKLKVSIRKYETPLFYAFNSIGGAFNDYPYHAVTQVLVENGAKTNATNDSGYTVLQIALSDARLTDRQKSILQFMAGHKDFDVNYATKGQTPFELTFNSRNEEFGLLMLKKGANISKPFKNGSYAIHRSTSANLLALTRALLEKDVDVNVKNKESQSPLHYAASGSHELLILILGKQNDKNSKDLGGWTPFFIALKDGSEKNALAMLPYAENSIHSKDPDGVSPLERGVNRSLRGVTKSLIEKGVNLDQLDKKGNIPLHFLIRKGWDEEALLAIPRVKKIDQSNNRGETPLSLAVSRNQTKVAQDLIQKGADVNVSLYDSPLVFYVLEKKNTDLVKAIMEKINDVNIVDQNGRTLLHFAVSIEDLTLVKYLLKKSVSVNIKDNSENTSIHLAKNIEILKLLLAQSDASVNIINAKGMTPLALMISNKNAQCAKLLIDKGANIQWRGKNETSLIHEAAKNDDVESVKLLLSKGLSPNLTNSKNSTPLFYAGQEPTIKVLLKNGGDINWSNNEGRTPLGNAVDRAFVSLKENFHMQSSLNTISYLLYYNADPTKAIKEEKRLLKYIVSKKDFNFRIPRPNGSINTNQILKVLSNSKKLQLNATDDKQATALFYVDTPQEALFLVELGVNKAHRNEDGQTAKEAFESSIVAAKEYLAQVDIEVKKLEAELQVELQKKNPQQSKLDKLKSDIKGRKTLNSTMEASILNDQNVLTVL